MPDHLACLPSFPLQKSNQMVSTVSACIGRATRSSRTGIPTTAEHMPQWDDASVRQAARSYNHEGNVTMAPVLSPPIQIGLSVACGKVTHSRLRIEVEALHPPKLRPADGLNTITTFESFHHVDSQFNGSLRTHSLFRGRDMVADPFNLVVSRTGEPSTSRTP